MFCLNKALAAENTKFQIFFQHTDPAGFESTTSAHRDCTFHATIRQRKDVQIIVFTWKAHYRHELKVILQNIT